MARSRKPIRAVSEKRQGETTKKRKPIRRSSTLGRQLRYRSILREPVIERSQRRCEAQTPECGGWMSQIHHRKLRSQGGADEPSNLLAVCAPCHGFIHANPALSYERGWLRRSWESA